MLLMGKAKGPARKLGFSAPSYSNLDSMSWRELIWRGSRRAPSFTVLR